MKKLLAVLLSTTCAVAAVPAFAQDADIPPVAEETVGVKPAIDPGPNIFAMDQSWDGLSTFQVFSAEDFTYKGGMGTGMVAQGQVSADGTTAYTTSTYLERITWGEPDMVLQVFDVATLSVTAEIMLPPKITMVAAYEHLLQLSADERFIFIMNATPAASVTVVDLEAGAVTMEVPTPGCWEIYPATSGLKFTMLCGDGAAKTFILNETGTEIVSELATDLFNVDDDPLFVHAERRGDADELLFVSYTGNVYRVSDAGDAPELIEIVSLTADVEAPFAPGGYALTAYNAANDYLFVVMHADPYDGSHKDAGDEVWVMDMAVGTLLYRLQPEHGLVSLYVDDAELPTLYGFNEEDYTIRSYAIDPAATHGIIMEETGAVSVGGGLVITVRE